MIYLDYNATHPPDEHAIKAALEVYENNFGNSSGQSFFSQKAKQILVEEKEIFANYFQLSGNDLLLTSSATEANAMAIAMIVFLQQSKSKEKKEPKKVHLISTKLEHPSILENFALFSQKYPQRIFSHTLAIDTLGNINYDELTDMLHAIAKKNEVAFLALMHAHNETGLTFSPLKAATILSQFPQTWMLVDAAQSIAKVKFYKRKDEINKSTIFPDNFEFRKIQKILPRTFFSIAGHKFGAGMGGAYLVLPSERDHLDPFANKAICLYTGGSQELGYRPGSTNLMAAVAMRIALENRLKEKNLLSLIEKNTNYFEEKLKQAFGHISNFQIAAEKSHRIPGTTLCLFPDVPIDFMLMGLDKEKIVVSTGTSCKSGSRTPSQGLMALGYSEKLALQAIRFSYGKNLTYEKSNMVVDALARLYTKLSG